MHKAKYFPIVRPTHGMKGLSWRPLFPSLVASLEDFEPDVDDA
jgi:hypothetical protein